MKTIIIIMALVVAYLTPMFIIKAIKSDGDRSQNYTILSGICLSLLLLYLTALLNSWLNFCKKMMEKYHQNFFGAIKIKT